MYKSLGPEECFEWGHFSLEQVLEYEYTPLPLPPKNNNSSPPTNTISTTFGDTLGVYPLGTEKQQQEPAGYESETDEISTTTGNNQRPKDEQPILVLGCGNSKLGEDLLDEGWEGPVVQADVSSRAIEAMSLRCEERLQTGDMQLVQDDATVLSAFNDNSVSACIDKGLVDALFCADDHDACASVLQSVNRVLKPGGIFVVFSFSRPEFLLMDNDDQLHLTGSNKFWKDLQVRQLDSILL